MADCCCKSCGAELGRVDDDSSEDEWSRGVIDWRVQLAGVDGGARGAGEDGSSGVDSWAQLDVIGGGTASSGGDVGCMGYMRIGVARRVDSSILTS